MARIYRFLALDIASALPGMERYMERSRRLKRKPHRYSLAEFGLRDGAVLERMAGYLRCYDVPVESEPARYRLLSNRR